MARAKKKVHKEHDTPVVSSVVPAEQVAPAAPAVQTQAYTVVVTSSVVCGSTTFKKEVTWEVQAVDEKSAVHSYWTGKEVGFKAL